MPETESRRMMLMRERLRERGQREGLPRKRRCKHRLGAQEHSRVRTMGLKLSKQGRNIGCVTVGVLKARPVRAIKADHGSPSANSIILARRQQPLNPSSRETGFPVSCSRLPLRLGNLPITRLFRSVTGCGKILDPANLFRCIRDLYASRHSEPLEGVIRFKSLVDQQCGQEQ
jgi:hypothetical protein